MTAKNRNLFVLTKKRNCAILGSYVNVFLNSVVVLVLTRILMGQREHLQVHLGRFFFNFQSMELSGKEEKLKRCPLSTVHM